MKSIKEKLEPKFHQKVEVGFDKTPGHSEFADATVVTLHDYSNEYGGVIKPSGKPSRGNK